MIRFSKLQQLFTEKWVNKDLLESFFKDKSKINSIIKNKSSKEYLSWLNEELTKEPLLNKEKQKNNLIIWNIIPVFYQLMPSINKNIDSNKITNQITLDSFTNYIENNIIKKFNLVTYDQIWINSIKYDWISDSNVWKNISSNNNIWNFSVALNLKSSYQDLLNLLNFIYNNWRLQINNWKLVNPVKENTDDIYSNLSNLLITIDSFDIEGIPSKNTDIVNSKVVLNFYVRWIWFEEFKSIQSIIKSKFDKLYKDILVKSKLCDNWVASICTDTTWSQLVSNIRNNFKEISIIKNKIDEKLKSQNIASIDVTQELDYWLKLSNSINNIEAVYNKNSTLVDNFNKKWIK